jgi:acetyl-CoA carboxylase alpha subunit
MSDWCSSLLAAATMSGPAADGRNVLGWPGYQPRAAVQVGVGPVAGHDVVVCLWDFATYGGSLGEVEAANVSAAAARAIDLRLPLLTIVRTGGTRLQEGVAALVGIARTAIALADLSAAGLPHVSIADNPTTGGVWVSVASHADLRAAIAGATVGFSGPRVITAMTGVELPAHANTAESAAAVGLVDAVLAPAEVAQWLHRAFASFQPPVDAPVTTRHDTQPPAATGWEQVQRARTSERPDGAGLLDAVVQDAVEMRGADDTVRAVAGRTAANRPIVAVALAARRHIRPTPGGFRLLTRAAALADRLGSDLVAFVDTPGADPLPASEQSGLAPAISEALLQVLACRPPTLAVVHGEGGSGGALAATVADRVVVTSTGYFTALAPEGAAMALHMSPDEAADRGGLTPADLCELGFADAYAPGSPAELRDLISVHLAELAERPQTERLAARRARWSGPLPGRC